jgi:hypothetical protein
MGQLDSSCVRVPGTLRPNSHHPHLEHRLDGGQQRLRFAEQVVLVLRLQLRPRGVAAHVDPFESKGLKPVSHVMGSSCVVLLHRLSATKM